MQSIYGWTQYIFSGAIWEKVVEWTRERRTAVVRLNQNADFARRNSDEVLPALDLQPILPGSVVAADFHPVSRLTKRKSSAKMNTTQLEPTFLNEEDYPASWVVYHKMLGVVKKTEAEEYEHKVGQFDQSSNDEEEEDEDVDSDEEKKDESSELLTQSGDLDDEKTVHHSNVSRRETREVVSSEQVDSSSASSNNPSSAFPILRSITASG